MCTRFFPLTNEEDILKRKALIATYMHVYASDDMWVKDFMYLSEQAHAIQEEKRKAYEKQQQPTPLKGMG